MKLQGCESQRYGYMDSSWSEHQVNLMISDSVALYLSSGMKSTPSCPLQLHGNDWQDLEGAMEWNEMAEGSRDREIREPATNLVQRQCQLHVLWQSLTKWCPQDGERSHIGSSLCYQWLQNRSISQEKFNKQSSLPSDTDHSCLRNTSEQPPSAYLCSQSLVPLYWWGILERNTKSANKNYWREIPSKSSRLRKGGSGTTKMIQQGLNFQIPKYTIEIIMPMGDSNMKKIHVLRYSWIFMQTYAEIWHYQCLYCP